MSDYKEQTTRVSGGGVGTPNLGVRNDTAGDLSNGNGKYVIQQFDSSGALRVTSEGGKPTYFGNSQFACDSTATDIAALPGNASTVVKVLGVLVTTTATAAATGNVSLNRRSSADTGQTAVNATLAQADTRDAAPSSTPQHFTAHPTALGTSAGIVLSERVVQQAAGTPPATRIYFDLVKLFGSKGLRLNGATDILCLNAPAALGGSGNAWDITWIWTEEPATA